MKPDLPITAAVLTVILGATTPLGFAGDKSQKSTQEIVAEIQRLIDLGYIQISPTTGQVSINPSTLELLKNQPALLSLALPEDHSMGA